MTPAAAPIAWASPWAAFLVRSSTSASSAVRLPGPIQRLGQSCPRSRMAISSADSPCIARSPGEGIVLQDSTSADEVPDVEGKQVARARPHSEDESRPAGREGIVLDVDRIWAGLLLPLRERPLRALKSHMRARVG